MPEITTVLTGFELKKGENANGSYVLTKFTADDGKQYQTFDEEIAETLKGKLGESVSLGFEVQSRTSNGKTFTNNVVTGIASQRGSDSVDASGGGSGGGSSVVLERLAAFRAAESIVATLFSSGQSEDYSFASIASAADNILAWAEGNLAGSEDAVPDADPEDAVPD